jgi:sRNA-binding carbon storage regulator CsrA
LGIEAPSNVRIFREEIVASPDRAPAERPVGVGV